MKSKTSFFNRVILKKDITRFFPVWVLYSIVLAICFIGEMSNNWNDMGGSLLVVQNMQTYMLWINAVYGCICAMVLFGDLYKSKLCTALHALPVRRECFFFTHVTAGLLFYLVPTTLLALFFLPVLGNYWYLAFLMLGISLLQFIAFYGMAVFAAMCAGNKVGMLAFYGLLNLLPSLLEGIIQTWFLPLLYGLQLDTSILLKGSPLGGMIDLTYIHVWQYDNSIPQAHFEGIAQENLLTPVLFAVFGLLFLGAALLIYRRRKLETAGDVVSNRPAAVTFQALSCALTGFIFQGISGSYILGFIGITLGYFAGKMLLHKKANVFKKGSFVTCGIILASAAALLLVTRLDPANLTRNFPEAHAVKSAAIIEDFNQQVEFQTENPEQIEAVLQINQELAQQQPANSGYILIFKYTLQDGSVVEYNYQVSASIMDGLAVQSYFSSWQLVFGTEDWDEFCNHITYIMVTDEDWDSICYARYSAYITEQERADEQHLLESMKSECSKIRPFLSIYDYQNPGGYRVKITSKYQGKTISCTLRIPRECEETVSVIRAMEDQYITAVSSH